MEMDDVSEHQGSISRKTCSCISVKMLLDRQFGPAAHAWDEEKKVGELNKATHIRLDRENIGCIDGLELLGKDLTNLYLQQNRIETIENLEFLPNLRFLTLSNNRIRRLEGLRHLRHLGFLDLSENLIIEADTDELPKGLVILNLEGNKCTSATDYRLNLIKVLPKLKTLDNTDLVRQEKLSAGYDVSDSEEDIEDDEGESDDDRDGEGDEERHRHIGQMLISSQRRLENDYISHKKKLLELDEIRENSVIPLTTRAGSSASYEN